MHWKYLNGSIAASSDKHVMVSWRIVQSPSVILDPVMQSRVTPQGDTVLLSCCHLRRDEVSVVDWPGGWGDLWLFWGGEGWEGGRIGVQGSAAAQGAHLHEHVWD